MVETVNIFANPIAGRGRGKWTAQRLEKRLTASGFAVHVFFEPPETLTSRQIGGDMRAAITIGGDGTLRAVADRLLTERGEVPPLLPVPLGTANLMGQHLGIAWNDHTVEAGVVSAVKYLHVRTLDAGRANGELFLLMAGVGFDAQVVHELTRIRNGPISKASYLIPALTTLRDYEFPALRVVVDGEEAWPSSPAIAFIGNVKEYGAGFPILPFAQPEDGLLDVCVMPCRTKMDLVRLFVGAAVGQHVAADDTVYLRGKTIRVDSAQKVAVQLDGDAGGYTPLNVSLLPVRLPFIVPPEHRG